MMLASIQHPNVIAYKEAFFEESSSTLCIVMELADGGDLYQKIIEH
jgi:NIMA (never in mitosis gene a)-related kinase